MSRYKNWAISSHSVSTNMWNGSRRDPWAHVDKFFTNVAENACTNCHNTHNAKGKARLMKSELEKNNCLDCHNGNVASTNIGMEVNKMYGHNVYKYNKIHNPFASGAIAKVKGID